MTDRPAIDFTLPPMPPLRAEDAKIPEQIPNIRHCHYLIERACDADAYMLEATGQVATDDEMEEMIRERLQANLEFGVLVPVPLTHMAYDQSLQELCERMHDNGFSVTDVDRERCRIYGDTRPYWVRLWWMHTGGMPGDKHGSANWTPERGARDSLEREMPES